MALLPDLSRRIYLPELMDAPDCDEPTLLRTYRQLALINRTISRMHGLLDRHVLQHAAQEGGEAHVVEVGCGGGDVLFWLATQARRRKLKLRFTGTDTDARALSLAAKRLASFPEVQLRALPLQQTDELQPKPDYVFCNHVLHHIPPADVPAALRAMQQAARRRLLVNDLHRSHLSYAAYTVLARLLFHRSFTFHDGRLSIRKGFVPRELEETVRLAGLPAETIVATAFPGRILVLAPGGAA